MKKATVASTAIWLGGALLLIAAPIAAQSWPVLAGRSANLIATTLALAVVAASTGSMKNVEPKEVLLSSLNSQSRNVLNVLNFIAAVVAALSFGYLTGLFVPVGFHTLGFAMAAFLLGGGIIVQLLFALVTAHPRV